MAAKSALACLLTKAKPWRHLLGPGDRKQPHHSAITAPKCPRDLKFFSPSANISCGACLRRPCGAAKQALRSQPPALSGGPYPLGPGLLPPLCQKETGRQCLCRGAGRGARKPRMRTCGSRARAPFRVRLAVAWAWAVDLLIHSNGPCAAVCDKPSWGKGPPNAAPARGPGACLCLGHLTGR